MIFMDSDGNHKNTSPTLNVGKALFPKPISLNRIPNSRIYTPLAVQGEIKSVDQRDIARTLGRLILDRHTIYLYAGPRPVFVTTSFFRFRQIKPEILRAKWSNHTGQISCALARAPHRVAWWWYTIYRLMQVTRPSFWKASELFTLSRCARHGFYSQLGISTLRGYLSHMKQPPLRTLQ